MAPPVGWLSSGQSGCGIVLSENAFFGAAVGAAVGTTTDCRKRLLFLVGGHGLPGESGGQDALYVRRTGESPIVYRLSLYYGGSMAAHHSTGPHPIFMHIPGFKVVFASNAYDAKGLLKTAIREDDPVIFCEDRTVLGARAEVPEEECSIPLASPTSSRGATPSWPLAGWCPEPAGRGAVGRGRHRHRGSRPPHPGAIG